MLASHRCQDTELAHHMHVIPGHTAHPHSPTFSHISLNFMSTSGLQFSPPGRLAVFSESQWRKTKVFGLESQS